MRALASKKRASTKAWWLGFRTHEAWPQLWPKDNARISGYLRYRDPRWRLWVLLAYHGVFVHHGCGCCLWCLVGRHRSLTAAVALDDAGSGPRVGSRGLNCGLSGVSSLSRRRLRRRLPRLWSEIALAVCPGTWARLPALGDAARARPSPLPPRSEEGRGREVQRAACSVAAARRTVLGIHFFLAKFFFSASPRSRDVVLWSLAVPDLVSLLLKRIGTLCLTIMALRESDGLFGYLGSSPLLWETQRELVPRPYLLALRRGEAARFKEQPALAAALRPSSD